MIGFEDRRATRYGRRKEDDLISHLLRIDRAVWCILKTVRGVGIAVAGGAMVALGHSRGWW